MRRATRVPQRVLIVGGGSEIGGALARAWLEQGAEEFILAVRDESRVGRLVDDIEAAGRGVRVIRMDALDRTSITPMIDMAWSDGDVDIVVIAIGLLGSQADIESDPSRAWDVVTVNATSSIQIALEAANRMESQQHGTIVLLSSVAGMRGRKDNYVYGASKAALDTFAEGLQQRLSGSPVDVVVARAGYVHSKMSAGIAPAPFAFTVEQSRDEILRAVTRGKQVVWVPRILSPLFYIFRMLPRRAWAAIVERAR